MDYTHEIIRMERGATKNSGSPMWRCQTADGQRVNVFQHSDPAKDSSKLFAEAGYMGDMGALNIGEALEWSGFPIQVQMQPDGDWWKVIAVAPRSAGAEADVLWQPDLEAYRRRAQRQVIRLRGLAYFALDLETTGFRVDDEIISIAVYSDYEEKIIIDELVRPSHPTKLNRIGKNGSHASDVHGIKAEDLENVPSLHAIYPNLQAYLSGATVVGYNVKFDLQMLDHNFSDKQLSLFVYDSVVDVAQIVAEFVGNWNAKRGWFELLKLEEACAYFDIQHDAAHNAVADVLATVALVKAMAEADVETWHLPL